MNEERVQKYLAACGIGSRRACEKLMAEGLVTVNGRVASLGDKVREGDVVCFNGREVKPQRDFVYLMLNKPLGVVSTARDDRGRKTVVDAVPEGYGRVYPVGRLDINTTGLLLLTNDGELANRLTHPSFAVEKTYRASIDGEISEESVQKLRAGVMLEDGMTAPAKVNVKRREDGWSVIEITIHEGKNRQVRRMLEAVGHRVRSLKRVRIGRILLGDLPKGEIRALLAEEIAYLKQF